MGQVINTNTLSLLTQNNLSKSQSALNTAIQRLSSGVRINSAKDDAAGQAIANRFNANIKGLTQAQRNANDGISLAQTTEGALNEVNNNLQRIRELTVQAANGSNSDADKASLQAEITQRLAEIDRTSRETDFNGTKVLSGAVASLSIQVGSQDGQTVSIDLQEISQATLGLTGFAVLSTTLTGTAASTDYAAASSDYAAEVGTAASSDYAVTGTAEVGTAASTDYAAQIGTAVVGTAASTDYAAQIGTAVVGTAASTDYAAASTDYAFTGTEFGTDYVVTGGTAQVGSAASTDYAAASTDYSAAVGTAASTDYAAASTDYSAAVGTAASTDYAAASTDYAVVGTAASTDYTAQVGTAEVGTAEVGTAASSDYVAALTTTASPLALIDEALAQVDSMRGALGAVQNRFDSIISNLGTTINNLTSSRSRIEDADYATEVSNMTRAQILQQAGTSVLAKANQSTQGVMALLQ